MSDRRISDSRKEQLLRVRQYFLRTEGIRDLCQSTEDHLQAVCQELGLAPPSMVCRASAETNEVSAAEAPPIGCNCGGEARVAGHGVALGVCSKDDAADACVELSHEGFLYGAFADLYLFDTPVFKESGCIFTTFHWLVRKIIDRAVLTHG